MNIYIMLPASAGIFPDEGGNMEINTDAPRKRGDVPLAALSAESHDICSPQARGCSHLEHEKARTNPMLPASAGMFPTGR